MPDDKTVPQAEQPANRDEVRGTTSAPAEPGAQVGLSAIAEPHEAGARPPDPQPTAFRGHQRPLVMSGAPVQTLEAAELGVDNLSEPGDGGPTRPPVPPEPRVDPAMLALKPWEPLPGGEPHPTTFQGSAGMRGHAAADLGLGVRPAAGPSGGRAVDQAPVRAEPQATEGEPGGPKPGEAEGGSPTAQTVGGEQAGSDKPQAAGADKRASKKS